MGPPGDGRAFVAFFGPVRPNDNLAIKGANNVIVTVSFAILGNAVADADGYGRGKEDEWKINGPNYRLSVPFTLPLAPSC